MRKSHLSILFSITLSGIVSFCSGYYYGNIENSQIVPNTIEQQHTVNNIVQKNDAPKSQNTTDIAHFVSCKTSKIIDSSHEKNTKAIAYQPSSSIGIYDMAFSTERLDKIYRDIYSENNLTRQQAIKIMAYIGSDAVKSELFNIASDEREDDAVRREIIQAMDWQEQPEKLAELIQTSKSTDIRLASISAINPKKLSDGSVALLEQSLRDNFVIEQENLVKILTLDYFSTKGSDVLQSFIIENEIFLKADEVQEHIRFLQTPPMEVTRDDI